MDGNTRLCTATAAARAQGELRHRRPARLLRRRRPLRRDRAVGAQRRRDPDGALGADARPAGAAPTRRSMIVVDPRRHRSARAGRRPPRAARRHQPRADERADPHELIARGWIDRAYVAAHTLGFDELRATRRARTRRERAAEICDVAGARRSRAAAEILGTCERLLSTVLQGFYQSNQATAAACPGQQPPSAARHDRPARLRLCQMNGQPTAQNTRETGADGDLPGFRNWDEPRSHRRARAALERRPGRRSRTGRRRRTRCRSSATPSRARSAALDLGTNPAVSLPDLRAHPRDPRAARSCSWSSRTSS